MPRADTSACRPRAARPPILRVRRRPAGPAPGRGSVLLPRPAACRPPPRHAGPTSTGSPRGHIGARGQTWQRPTALAVSGRHLGLGPIWPRGIVGRDPVTARGDTLTALAGRTSTSRPDRAFDATHAARLDEPSPVAADADADVAPHQPAPPGWPSGPAAPAAGPAPNPRGSITRARTRRCPSATTARCASRRPRRPGGRPPPPCVSRAGRRWPSRWRTARSWPGGQPGPSPAAPTGWRGRRPRPPPALQPRTGGPRTTASRPGRAAIGLPAPGAG